MAEGNQSGYLTGQLLVAMPTMEDPRFAHSVIYVCVHSEDGAMGLVLNQYLGEVTFPDLLEQVGIDIGAADRDIRVHFGGPVDAERGFVLHTADYVHDGTMLVGEGTALTATVDILRAIAEGAGPSRFVLALGYAGWAPGQLESEIEANGWLSVSADTDIVFDPDLASKWHRAIGKLGIDPAMLSVEAGHA